MLKELIYHEYITIPTMNISNFYAHSNSLKIHKAETDRMKIIKREPTSWWKINTVTDNTSKQKINRYRLTTCLKT